LIDLDLLIPAGDRKFPARRWRHEGDMKGCCSFPAAARKDGARCGSIAAVLRRR
jgi:hypothetical protein